MSYLVVVDCLCCLLKVACAAVICALAFLFSIVLTLQLFMGVGLQCFSVLCIFQLCSCLNVCALLFFPFAFSFAPQTPQTET